MKEQGNDSDCEATLDISSSLRALTESFWVSRERFRA